MKVRMLISKHGLRPFLEKVVEETLTLFKEETDSDKRMEILEVISHLISSIRALKE